MNKMSEVFKLPFTGVSGDYGGEVRYFDTEGDNLEGEKANEAAVHAINSHDALTERVKALEDDLDKAKADADGLATSIFNRHYKEISPVGFELLDSVTDVISQIDNMSVGLLNRIDRLEGALNKIALEDFTTKSAIWFIADNVLKAGE